MSDIIADLAPRLRGLGYEIYFDSCTGGMPIDELINVTESKIADYAKSANLIEEFNRKEIEDVVGKSHDWSDKIRIKLIEATQASKEITYYFAISTLIRCLDEFESEREIINNSLKQLVQNGNISMLDPGFLIKHDEAVKQIKKLSDQFKDSVTGEIHDCRQNASITAGKVKNIKAILSENIPIRTVNNTMVANMAKFILNLNSLDDAILNSSFMQMQENFKHGNPLQEETADILFNETRSMFALIHLSEMAGLQKLLVKMQTQNNINCDFDFIYFRGGPISEIFDIEPEKVREDNTTNLPLGLTEIDVTQKTKVEIVEMVMRHVSARIAAGTTHHAAVNAGQVSPGLFQYPKQTSDGDPSSSTTTMTPHLN